MAGGLAEAFFRANMKTSRVFDSIFPAKYGQAAGDALRIYDYLEPGMTVADIGGGKRPALDVEAVQKLGITYVGLDLDPDELACAPEGVYQRTEVLDLTEGHHRLDAAFDLIICKHTLEHVEDGDAALANLIRMLKPGGRCLIAAPCRHAVFARINLMMPEQLKRKLLFWMFPNKFDVGGFPARYHRSSPPEFADIVRANGAEVTELRIWYWSSYFTPVFPAYVAWRLYSLAQAALNRGYCERFEMVIMKRSESGRAA